jgi:hypothetical protein
LIKINKSQTVTRLFTAFFECYVGFYKKLFIPELLCFIRKLRTHAAFQRARLFAIRCKSLVGVKVLVPLEAAPHAILQQSKRHRL